MVSLHWTSSSMKVLIQWAKDNPIDWIEIDSSEWNSLPKKDDPSGQTQTIDGSPGWINRICVQGVEFTADHYAIEEINNGGIRVYSWTDSETPRHAEIFEFYPLAPDPALGGAINTRQSIQYFIYRKSTPAGVGNTSTSTWDDFIKPNENKTRHGVLLPTDLYEQHEGIRITRGWREWTEGLDKEEIENGQLREQRKIGRYNVPDGTRTYYQDMTTLTGVHTGVIDSAQDTLLTLSPAGSNSMQGVVVGGGDDMLYFAFTTPVNEPDSDDWPDGVYRCQIDVTSVGAAIVYGVNTQAGSVGHFARVNSALSSDLETVAQTESDFTGGGGTGLKLATTGSTTWTAGDASDRFEVLWAASRPANHGNQRITIQVGVADSFVDGPWEAAPEPDGANNASFFAMNF